MAIGPTAERMPPATLVIDEAVLTFLSRYGTPEPIQAAPQALSLGQENTKTRIHRTIRTPRKR